MYNTVIFSNNLEFVKKYNNIFSIYLNDINIVGIASNKEELIYLDQKRFIDLVILNCKDFLNEDIKSFLNSIKKVIVVCKGNINFRSNENITFISEKHAITNNINKLQVFLNHPIESKTKVKIRKILESLNFNFKLKGTNYLLEAILYSYINKNDYLYENLEKNIYSHLSEKHNVSISVIKHSIIRSINNTNSNKLKSFLNNLDKITSKAVITEIVNSI